MSSLLKYKIFNNFFFCQKQRFRFFFQFQKRSFVPGEFKCDKSTIAVKFLANGEKLRTF